MGTQNLNNHSFKKVEAKISYDSYYDLFLASDETDYNTQVVHSNNTIDYLDGDKLPVWIDLNDVLCSTKQEIHQLIMLTKTTDPLWS